MVNFTLCVFYHNLKKKSVTKNTKENPMLILLLSVTDKSKEKNTERMKIQYIKVWEVKLKPCLERNVGL